jgi:hypothetical protein
MTDEPSGPIAVPGQVITSLPPGGASQRLTPLPCHHGCGCGIEDLVVHNLSYPQREATELDNGETAALFSAARQAAELLDGHHAYVRELRERTIDARSHAENDLEEFREVVVDDDVGRAITGRRRVEDRHRHLAPELLDPPSAPIRALQVTVTIIVTIFDIWFFYTAFLNLQDIPITAPAWQKLLALLPGLVLPAGLIFVGKMLSVPTWRMVAGWRRPAGPDDSPLATWARRFLRFSLVAALPLLLLWVIAMWAVLRGYLIEDESYPVPSYAVVLLVVVLALTTMGLEILISNPYARAAREANDRVQAAAERFGQARRTANDSLSTFEREWRNLRSARDELLSKARVEMGRAWETLILPARLRHGRAGLGPPALIGLETDEDQRSGDIIGSAVGDGDLAGPDDLDVDAAGGASAAGELTEQDVHAVLQFFHGVHQPPPGLGPLAETVRSVNDLSPHRLRSEWNELCRAVERRSRGATPASKLIDLTAMDGLPNQTTAADRRDS